MHRLKSGSVVDVLQALFVLSLATGCGNSKPPETATVDVDSGALSGEGAVGDHADGGSVTAAKDECVGFEVANLEDFLLKSACEEPDQKPDLLTPVDFKGKLEVTLTASPTKPAPGSKVELLVTFANKSKEPLVLHFKIDPVPRFEVEVFDTKKDPKRVDLPAVSAPPPPAGAKQPPPTEPKSARLTLSANGTARVRIPWEAVKTKWAPEKFRGTPPERGYPRAPAGPLPKGKYTIKVVSPLVGVSEGVNHEMSTPKVDMEIGG